MPPEPFENYTKEEYRALKRLRTPEQVQAMVDTLTYAYAKRISPKEVLEERRADCLEAALFACAALHANNIKAFLIDLRAVRDEDHVLCVYKIGRHYGSIAQSKFIGLRGRSCTYHTIKELVLSYFEHYFNFYGEPTLREYSVPLQPERYPGWTSEVKATIKIEDDLDRIKHYRILPDEERLPRVSAEKFWKEILILPKNVRVGKRYEEALTPKALPSKASNQAKAHKLPR